MFLGCWKSFGIFCNQKSGSPVTLTSASAFSALTLLVGWQEEHPTCKTWVMRCWCGYLSGARCRFFAYGPADATAIPEPHHLLPHLNPDWFSLYGTGLQVGQEKRLLNGSSSNSSNNSSLTGGQSSWFLRLEGFIHVHYKKCCIFRQGFEPLNFLVSVRSTLLIRPSCQTERLYYLSANK